MQKVYPKINIEKIKNEAEELFKNGGYSCSESVVASVRNNIAPDMPAAFISAAGGFGSGVGRSKCMCGAVSGAVLCLGYFLGRVIPGTPTDPQSTQTLAAAFELQDSFRKNHKVLCCHVHSKDGANKERCASFAGEMAGKAAEIIAKELAIAVVQ